MSKLDGDLAGTYKSLTEMSYDERNRLIEEHILYNDADDKYLRSAGGYNDWPVSAATGLLELLLRAPPIGTEQLRA